MTPLLASTTAWRCKDSTTGSGTRDAAAAGRPVLPSDVLEDDHDAFGIARGEARSGKVGSKRKSSAASSTGDGSGPAGWHRGDKGCVNCVQNNRLEGGRPGLAN